MKKKKIIAAMMSAAMLFSVVTPYLPVQAEEEAEVLQETDEEAERETINFNTDWHYHKGDAAGADQAAFADDGWVYVNLPHSTDFYDADNKDAYLGISWYRKDFTPNPSLEGKELLLTFEAAMQKAEVYLNGEKIMTHEGGYSPFVIDLTGLVNYGETNVIAVKIDSSPNTNFAPGKTNPDFQYWGGIYGEAYLTVKDPVHITDAVEADTTAGGGVFITAPEVGTESAVVKVKTQVENLSGEEQNVTLRTEILNEDGTEAASQESTEEIGSAEASDFTHVLTVDDPRLWSTYTPELYTVRTTVYVDGVKKDSVDTTYGIRKVEWKRDGLYVNDVLTKVNGANLHSETYMVGNAMTESAIYAEVKQFKENGFDFVRMSHYPHVQAFYDACDKYGVMVLECASGWQYFNNTDAFKNSTYEELRTTIRSHRNHPSIMAWETSLNESNYNAAWAKEMNRIAKEEYPTDGVSYAWTAGCIQWDAWDIGLGTPQANIFKSGAQGAENPAYADKPIIVAEYGDWTYGGSNSSTRVTREKENSYGKKGGDEGMLIQCDNIQESVALMNSEDYVGASMFWDYADYAGFDAGMLTYCGVVDLSRIEKHSAYFFRSQRDPEVDMSEYGVETGPMVYIANLWDSAADNSEVRVFSNCDEVALYYNDELVAVQGHDETMWGPHGDTSESGSPGSGAGKEISTENLEYPPVTFDLSAYTAGEGTLRAVGLIDGEEAAEYVRKAPGEAASVQLRPQDDSALKLDGSDARLVWIDIADADGTVVTDAYTDVDLSITGPGLIVGPKTVQTRGGQLAVWVKSKRGEGEITLTAQAEGLAPASVTFATEAVQGLPEVPEGGDADEYEFEPEEVQNIFLGKATSASTENIKSDDSKSEYARYAVDGNNNTKWCASSGSYPQWWMADLGAPTRIETLLLSLETSGAEYYYTIAVSDEEITDENVKDCIVVDNSAGSTETAFEFENVSGRYVRIDFTKSSNKEWAVLREVSGTGESTNIALNKPVEASSVNVAGSGKVEKAEYANDGNPDTQWCAKGGQGTSGHWWQVNLGDTYQLSMVKIQFEFENAGYKFVLQGSVDGEHYRDLADYRSGDGCGKNVEIESDDIVQYLRVYDITTNNMGSRWPVIQEFEAYGEKTEYRPLSVSREKTTYASSSREDSMPEYGSNGVPNYYWYPATLGEEWWLVDTEGIYELDNIQMTWNAGEEHRYLIEGSLDGESWFTLADRTENGTDDVRPYELAEGAVRFIRVTLPEGRTSDQGFGLFDAYGVEAASRSVLELTAPEPVKVEAGTAPEDMELPENVLVTLEDGAQAAVPVEWDLTSLSVEGNTGTMTGTARAIPGIIMEDTETTLTIQYTESAQPVRIQLLQAAYDLVKDADLTDVVESIVELYNERISAAEALLARAEAGDPALTQEEVDQSVEDLIEIVQYLSFTGNKDELEKVITAAQEMEAELDKYLEKGQAEFLAALETAENVMADGDALQEEINDVMLQLVKGMADLRLRPDKSLLEELLKEANGKNKESYTEESYQNLLSAISVADAAYSNLEADQEEVDGAAELLRAAIDSLEPAGSPDPENPDPETPGTGTSDPEPESPVSDPEDSNTGKPEGNSSDAGTQSSSLDGKKTASASGNASDAGNGNAQSAAKAVRTGDNAHPAIYAAVLLALAAGAGYTVCGRRKKK